MTKRLRLPPCGVLFCLLSAAALAGAAALPALRGRVNDYARILSVNEVRSLETQLAKLEGDTGHQLALLTVSSLGGEDIEGFGIRVAESWQLGKKGFDNGAILIVAVTDRRLRLEVGYGLEGVLPDALASRIIREYIVPHFRAGAYAAGIAAGITAVEKVLRQEPLPESAHRQRQLAPELNFLAMLAVTFIIFLLIAFGSAGSRRRRGVWSAHGRRHGPAIWGSPGAFGGGFSRGSGFGGGFSGGGGGFGGGGATGRW